MSTDRRTSAPAVPAPIQVSPTQAKKWKDISDYNAKVRQMQAAGKFTADNAPFASPTTAPEDLNNLIRSSGVPWDGPMPAEEGLHSGSGAVDPFNRTKPSTSQPQAQQTQAQPQTSQPFTSTLTATASRPGSFDTSNPFAGTSRFGLGGLTTDAPAAAPTTSDGTPIAPHLTQLLQTPLPADVAQTVLAQNRSAAGGITGLAAPVPLTGPTSIPTYGNGTATFAADMAARRAPGGSPYGMLPVDPTTQGQTYVGDGRMTFNGQVLPAGQTLTLLPNGRKINGQAPAAQPSAPTSTASAPATAPAGHVATTLGASYPTTPQGVAASDRNAQASPSSGAQQTQLPAWIAGMTDPATLARGGASAPASTTAPSGSISPGTAAALAVRAGIGNAGQAIGGALNSARDTVRTAVDSAASNTADFGSTLLGLPSASPATRNAGVDAVNSYAANNPTMASLVNVPKAPAPPAAPSYMAGGYDLAGYGLKPPGTAGTAVAGTSPAGPAPAAPTAAPATGSPSVVANKGLLANAGIGTGTPLPSATSTNPLFVPTPTPQVNVNGTPASLAAAPTAAQALSTAPTASQALADAPSAAQALSRPGFQTNTGGVVSDADEALNRRTDADQALNPDKPPGSVTPGAGNNLLNAGSNLLPGYVDQMRNQATALDSPSPLTLGNTATNDGSTSLNGQPPADHVSSVLGNYATPAGVSQSSTPGAPPTPRTTAPNPGMVGATPEDPNTPLGDDEEMGPNGVRRKKLQSSTAPAAPGPSSASAPSGSDS